MVKMMKMKNSELNDKEKLLPHGLVRYPQLTNNQLSEKIGLKHSTVSSLRRKLKEKDYLRIMEVLKENNWIVDVPLIQIYSLNTSVFIRDFMFAPLVRKITGG